MRMARPSSRSRPCTAGVSLLPLGIPAAVAFPAMLVVGATYLTSLLVAASHLLRAGSWRAVAPATARGGARWRLI